MKRWIFSFRRNCIIGLVGLLIVACAPAARPTVAPPSPIPPTSTPLPTPLPQFATVTVPAGEANRAVLPTLPTSTPLQGSIKGSLSSQGATIFLYNGPQGATKDEANDAAPITILGRSDDGQWIEIRLDDSTEGWVRAANVNSDVSMSGLPITGYVPQDTPTPSPDAIVRDDAAGLRLRTQPNTESSVLTNMDAGAVLTVIGRSSDSEWLQVIAPNRQRGWAMARFMEVYVDVLRLPVTFGIDPTLRSDDNMPASQLAGDVIVNITAKAQEIFDRGLTLGNRPNVFSKIGDSLTSATWAFYPIGWGQQTLGEYGYLQPVINNFSSEIIRDGSNSFANISLAADNAWTTEDLLDPTRGDPNICGVNETPLDCEYRISRPSIALILIGTNDVGTMDSATYRANLEAILDKTIARSVLPVVSTLPERDGYDAQIQEFNDIITQTARQYQIPIWNFNNVLAPLPNRGLDADGLHLSYPPGTLEQWEAAANFTGDALNYGYNMRNLTALQVLDAIWRQVILGESS